MSLTSVPGQKPFGTIKDLVEDGLITLHMEAHNVEEYLREKRVRIRQDISRSSNEDKCKLLDDQGPNEALPTCKRKIFCTAINGKLGGAWERG